MHPSNAHVVRFIELGPVLDSGADGPPRVQQATDADIIARFDGQWTRVRRIRRREVSAHRGSNEFDADEANDHAFGSPCHNVAPRQNARRNAANPRQAAASLPPLGKQVSD